jgi:DNA-binding NarL/FixJ family response regulator
MTLRVLLADDQALVRTGFRMILKAEPDIEVVGEAADGEQAVAAT